MKRKYTVEIDVRAFQSLEHYGMGLEDGLNNDQRQDQDDESFFEATDIVKDIVWQITQAEKDRNARIITQKRFLMMRPATKGGLCEQ